MNAYSCDWAHEKDKLRFYNGKKILSKPTWKDGDKVVTENMPDRYAKILISKGVEIFRAHQNLVSKYRKELGVEKSDDNDVKLIYQYYNLHLEDFKRYIGESKLRCLYASFKEIQKLRVSTSNRLWSNGDDFNGGTLSTLETLEKDIIKEMKKELENYPIWEWLKPIKGINCATAAGLIASVNDIGRFECVGSLWSYFALDVVDGHAPRREKGKEYNKHLKGKSLILGIIGDSFIKQRTPHYRDIYDNEKIKQRKLHPEAVPTGNKTGFKKKYTDMHVHRMAIRKMMKRFIADYWVMDRQLNGFPTKPPYVHDVLKHKHYVNPPFVPEILEPFSPMREEGWISNNKV